MMRQHRASSVRKAFTLIEMLVVLLIIGLLAAILFPVLKQVRENGYQAACATNLHQIYLAVELYKNDEGGYPASLGVLLGNTENLAKYDTVGADTGTPELDTGGKGYFKGGKDALICPDDDTTSTLPRSSYGDISTRELDSSNKLLGPTSDFGRYGWNYLGYRVQADKGTCSDTDVSQCLGTSYKQDDAILGSCTDLYSSSCVAANYASVFEGITVGTPAKYPYLINPNLVWDATTNPIDVTKLPRLVNRFAPLNTIITHCVFHRLPTTNIVGNYDIYNADGSGQGAKDVILRLDGVAKVIDVSTANFATGQDWAVQKF